MSAVELSNINITTNETKKLSEDTIEIELEENSIWQDIDDQYNKERKELETYIRKRDGMEDEITLDHHPVIAYLNETVFPQLSQALMLLLEKVRDEESCYHQKSAFNGIDFLSEYLFNKNPKYPERMLNWTYIFDMDWVQEFLNRSPRRYYPFSLIWSREYAALKIQSYLRGYWVRRRPEIQEVRSFWKDYRLSKQTEAIK